MNTLLYKKKYISDTLFSKGLMFLWCVRDGWRGIYLERGLLLPHLLLGSLGVPTLASLASSSEDASARLRCPSLDCDSYHCLNLTAWLSSRGLLPVIHLFDLSALIVLSCLLITTWQLVKAHGVTRNEPKIHGISYITKCLCMYCICVREKKRDKVKKINKKQKQNIELEIVIY